MVIQHAFHQNLPPYCIDPSDGKSYLAKRIELKAADLISLVDSIDLSRIDFRGCWEQLEGDATADKKDEIEGAVVAKVIRMDYDCEDEDDVVDYEVDTMVSVPVMFAFFAIMLKRLLISFSFIRLLFLIIFDKGFHRSVVF